MLVSPNNEFFTRMDWFFSIGNESIGWHPKDIHMFLPGWERMSGSSWPRLGKWQLSGHDLLTKVPDMLTWEGFHHNGIRMIRFSFWPFRNQSRHRWWELLPQWAWAWDSGLGLPRSDGKWFCFASHGHMCVTWVHLRTGTNPCPNRQHNHCTASLVSSDGVYRLDCNFVVVTL